MLKGGKAGPLQPAGNGRRLRAGLHPLENQDASDKTPRMRRAIGHVPGATTYLSGFPALNHDTQPIYNKDLQRGETIAVPIALLVMVFMFGTLGGDGRADRVRPDLDPHDARLRVDLRQLHRHGDLRDEHRHADRLRDRRRLLDAGRLPLPRGARAHDDALEALRTTMATAGRATLFSGATVAVGLALLVLMPLPFMRSMGIGGLLVPLVSMAASATLLPALLAVMGRGINRFRFVPRRCWPGAPRPRTGFWTGSPAGSCATRSWSSSSRPAR